MKSETTETEVILLRKRISELEAKIKYMHAVNSQLREDIEQTERFRNYWWELATKTRDTDPLDLIASSVSANHRRLA